MLGAHDVICTAVSLAGDNCHLLDKYECMCNKDPSKEICLAEDNFPSLYLFSSLCLSVSQSHYLRYSRLSISKEKFCTVTNDAVVLLVDTREETCGLCNMRMHSYKYVVYLSYSNRNTPGLRRKRKK